MIREELVDPIAQALGAGLASATFVYQSPRPPPFHPQPAWPPHAAESAYEQSAYSWDSESSEEIETGSRGRPEPRTRAPPPSPAPSRAEPSLSHEHPSPAPNDLALVAITAAAEPEDDVDDTADTETIVEAEREPAEPAASSSSPSVQETFVQPDQDGTSTEASSEHSLDELDKGVSANHADVRITEITEEEEMSTRSRQQVTPNDRAEASPTGHSKSHRNERATSLERPHHHARSRSRADDGAQRTVNPVGAHDGTNDRDRTLTNRATSVNSYQHYLFPRTVSAGECWYRMACGPGMSDSQGPFPILGHLAWPG